MSTSAEYMDGLNAPVERRFYSRVTPPTPIYVAFGSNNLGVLHNVSENGFQVSTPSGLPLNSVFRVFLSLNGAPKTIAVTVRTIWTDNADNRSGIQLLDLADEDREQIRQWVELELSRSEHSTPWFLPKPGSHAPAERPSATLSQNDQPANDRQSFNEQSAEGAASQSDPVIPPLPQAPPEQVPPTHAARVATPPISAAESSSPRATRPENANTVPSNSASGATSELPPIANPFDDPSPNSQFQQFPPVPLPIHGEFKYGAPPSKQRRRAATLSSRMRTKPLIVWAAVLAVVCFGANALVRYKLKLNAQRFASESAKYTAPKSDASASSGEPDENSLPASTDSQASASNNDATSKNQQPSTTPSDSRTSTARNDSFAPAVPPASHSAAKNSDASQIARQRESSVGARDNGAYTATEPPPSQSAATPRSWSAPAPSRSASTSAAANEVPQSPNVTGSTNNTPAQSESIVSQARPTPPPAPAAQTPSTNNASNSASGSNLNAAASAQQPRTQPQPNPQSSTYASNTNAPASRPQSPIYNANAPQQRSAVMGSIGSVRSSGIFDSNDVNASAASRGNNSASANAASRSVSNNSVVPSDTPQDHDVEIVAPKGFAASYVEVPGERVVHSAAGTIRIRRMVRVPGERIPGQRWLWRGKLNVTLGDVVSRVDPAVVQSSGASGSLTVQATIDKDGYVTDLKPLYGNFAMLPAVSRTVRNWRYDPTYLDNKRAETTAQVEFNLNPPASAPTRAARP